MGIIVVCSCLLFIIESSTSKSVVIDVEFDMSGNAIVTETWTIKSNIKANQTFSHYLTANNSTLSSCFVNGEAVKITIDGQDCKKIGIDKAQMPFKYTQIEESQNFQHNIFVNGNKKHVVQIKYTLTGAVKYIDNSYYVFNHKFLSNNYQTETSVVEINVKAPSSKFSQKVEILTDGSASEKKDNIKILSKNVAGEFDVQIRLSGDKFQNLPQKSYISSKDMTIHAEDKVVYKNYLLLQWASMLATFIDFQFVEFTSIKEVLIWILPFIALFIINKFTNKGKSKKPFSIDWEERASKVAILAIIVIIYSFVSFLNPFANIRSSYKQANISVQIKMNGDAIVTETWVIKKSNNSIQSTKHHFDSSGFQLTSIMVDGTICQNVENNNQQPYTYTKMMANGNCTFEIFMNNKSYDNKTHVVKITYKLTNDVKSQNNYYLFTHTFLSKRYKAKVKDFSITIYPPNDLFNLSIVKKPSGDVHLIDNAIKIVDKKVNGAFNIQIKLKDSKFNKGV